MYKVILNSLFLALATPLLAACASLQGPVKEVNAETYECDSYAHSSGSGDSVTAALDYIGREMDVFHCRTVIYDDLESGGDRYQPSGWMGEPPPWREGRLNVTHSTDNPASGATCLKMEWHPAKRKEWVGVYWQHPESNWGTAPGIRGLDLTGATTARFSARGETGNEVAEFKFGGIPGNVAGVTSHPMKLTKEWRHYEMNLKGADLRNVIGGFCWVAKADHNPRGSVIYLDNIEVDHARLDEARLVRSYHVGRDSLQQNGNFQLRNISFLYDNALAICALLSSKRPEDHRRAKLIADAFVRLSEWNNNGWLRNAYACGDIFGMRYDKKTQRWLREPRAPYRLNRDSERSNAPKILLDRYALGLDAGNMSWAALALLHCWDQFGEERYLEIAATLARWVVTHCSKSLFNIGFTGGYEWNSKDEKFEAVHWQSTEHNIDFTVVCKKLAVAMPEHAGYWLKNADNAAAFVRWAAKQAPPRLITGTMKGLAQPAFTPKPLDPQTWSVLAFREEASRYQQALSWASTACKVSRQNCWGFGFSELPTEEADSSDIWPEGTAQAALAYKRLGLEAHAQEIMKQLDCVIESYPRPDAAHGGIPAAYPTVVVTGFGWNYYNFPHVGATAWYVLAQRNWNPYWPPLQARQLQGVNRKTIGNP